MKFSLRWEWAVAGQFWQMESSLNRLLFCRSRCRRRRRCLNSLISYLPLPYLASATQATRTAWENSASTLPTAKTLGCWSIEGLTFIPINHWYLFTHIWAEVERVNLERSILSSEITHLKALFARSSHINKNSRVKQREWWQNYLTGKHATYPNQPWWSAVRGREWNPSLYPVQQPWERTNIMWKQFASRNLHLSRPIFIISKWRAGKAMKEFKSLKDRRRWG